MKEKDLLILVDENDRVCGKLEKDLVHQKGMLHRAFSVFIFNSKGEMLLQQRADNKYHSGGLWTNACCSHPRFNEKLDEAVKRRLVEEMGLICDTEFAFNFQYKAIFDNGLIENELDHVYMGITDAIPLPNLLEVKNWKFHSIEEIRHDLRRHPENYTHWFKLIFEKVVAIQNKEIKE